MAYDINASLERLEQNLKNIDSARLQVEKTIMSSNQLQSKMTDFITSMSELLGNINEWKSRLENSQQGGQETLEKSVSKISEDCDIIIAGLGTSVQKINDDLLQSINKWKDDKKKSQEQDQKTLEESVSKISKDCDLIILNLGTSLDNACKMFKDRTKSSITLFKDENNKLAEQVEKINLLKTAITNTIGEISSVKSSLNSLLTELKNSQEAQDKILMGIDTKIIAVTPSIKKLLDEMGKNSEESDLKIMTRMDETHSLLTQMQETLAKTKATSDKIKTSSGEIKAAADNIKLSLSKNETTLNEILSTLANANEVLLSTAKTNRWIIIIGIVLLAILQIVLTKIC